VFNNQLVMSCWLHKLISNANEFLSDKFLFKFDMNNKIKHMRKLLFIPLVLISMLLNAQGQLNILGTDNSVDSRALSEIRTITFDSDNVIVTNASNEEESFLFDDLLKLTFEEGIISGISDEDLLAANALSVYPNPISGNDLSVQVELNESAPVNLALRNIEGETISLTEENGFQGINDLSVPLNNVTAGVYILTVTSGEQTFSQRITKY